MSSPTKVPANMTSGVIKTAEKASATGTSGSSQVGAVVQLNSSEKIPSQYLSTGVHLGGVAAANLLDDYEEGTFSVAEQNGAGVGVTLTQAQYTKIGRTVFIYVDLAFTGSNSNAVSFSSLPFAANSSKDQQFNVHTNVVTSFPQVFAKGSSLNTVKNNATANLLYSDVSGKFLRISGFYQID